MKTEKGMPVWVLILAVILLNAGAATAGSMILARVGNKTITERDLLAYASQRKALRLTPLSDTLVFRRLIDGLIEDRLVELEAEKVNLEHDRQFQEEVRREMTRAAISLYEVEEFLPRLTIDSTQIDSFYHANIERYTVPSFQERIRQITVYKEGKGVPEQYTTYVDPVYDGWDPKRKIDSIYTRLANGEDFTKLAKTHSEEIRAKSTGGDWGWVSLQSLREPEIRDQVWDLPLHMISKPFESSFGYHIAQVIGRREPGPAPIDTVVKQDIISSLKRTIGKKMAGELTDSLVAVTPVVYDQDVLATADTLLDQETVMAIVGGRDTIWTGTYLAQKRGTSAFRAQRVLSSEEKKTVLQPLIESMCLYRMLRELGYLERDIVQEVRRRLIVRRALEIVRDRFMSVNYNPDSAAVLRYYRRHIRDYMPKLRHQALIKKVSDAARARAIADQWRGGRPPGNVESRLVGPSNLPRAVWNKVAAVAPGGIVGPVAVKGEYWIVQLVRIAQPKPLKDARVAIINKLRADYKRRVRQSWVRKMRQRYPVVQYDQRLRHLTLPARDDAEAILAGDSTVAVDRP